MLVEGRSNKKVIKKLSLLSTLPKAHLRGLALRPLQPRGLRLD